MKANQVRGECQVDQREKTGGRVEERKRKPKCHGRKQMGNTIKESRHWHVNNKKKGKEKQGEKSAM